MTRGTRCTKFGLKTVVFGVGLSAYASSLRPQRTQTRDKNAWTSILNQQRSALRLRLQTFGVSFGSGPSLIRVIFNLVCRLLGPRLGLVQVGREGKTFWM
ncbi:hypothetical protein D9758_004338 [Tetrapyrgos nigripes]|uniref:Uncharacterized protein n=1 Tax=Tetrapyrgos nigripes TaxID=182062 RepID=A0A8H5GNR3_9AGAR|nr:hypothetical protein D9758_004338 [Tetrapyrgos nigripes]